jgi:sugar lactone lactonase YvrE
MGRAEWVVGGGVEHGEGPCWADDWGGLRYVDMMAGDIMSLDAATATVTRSHVGDVAAVIRPRTSGGAVIALRDRIAITDGPLDQLSTLATIAQPSSVRLNEGGCDPDGNFYCGSMADDQTAGAGTFYRVSPTGAVDVVIDSVTVSNGFDFSPDGRVAYYIDTPQHGIDIFDYSAEGGLQDRRRWVDIDEADGSPDGLVVDAEGGVWVALFGGSAVRRYAADGTLDAVIELPVTNVTACTFGGPDRRTLYITTSRQGIDPGMQPSAGSLFAAEPGVNGRPVRPFAG